MKPILYESRETDFNHNGLGKMSETLSAIVTEVANGEFELEVVYPIGGRLYNHIQEHMLIKAKPNSVDDPHVFRIYEHTIDTVEQTVTIHAYSKSNDLGLNLVKDVVINSLTPQEAMNSMKMNLVEPTDYSFVSDITTRSSTEWKNRNPLNCIAGEEGSLIQHWGGEIKRDNRTIYLYRRRGNDKVAVIREGKDLGGVSIEYSTKGMVTKIIPFRTYTPEGTENEITEYGTPVESQYVGNYPVKYIVAVDYSNEDDVTSLQTMNTKASRYFTENNGIDKPNINVSVNLVELSESPEYEKFKDLENKQLFDSLTIYSKKYDINIEAKVNTLVYDSLGEKNISLTMGSYKTGLMESTERTYKDLLTEREAQITNVIQRTANGKNRIFRGVDEPTTGMVKNDLWYKPVGDGETEMYQFNGSMWELIMDTSDTTKNAREIERTLEEVEEAKRQAKLDADQALVDAKAHAEAEDARIKQEIGLEVDGAIEIAEQAKADAVTEASQAYEDAVAEADRLAAIRDDGITIAAGQITAGVIDAARLNAVNIVTSGLTSNVIKSTHLETSTATIDKLFTNQAMINQLTTKTAFINSIKAVEIDAGKITSGTINAARLNASAIVTAGLTAGVIKSTHISAEAALFDKLFSTTSATDRLSAQTAWIKNGMFANASIDGAKIQDATIGSAKIANLDASKISTGTLDGISITGGDVYLRNSSGNVNAGMSSAGTTNTSTRIWAGSNFAGRGSAAFRVQQNGKMIATDADISGKITADTGQIGIFDIKPGEIEARDRTQNWHLRIGAPYGGAGGGKSPFWLGGGVGASTTTAMIYPDGAIQTFANLRSNSILPNNSSGIIGASATNNRFYSIYLQTQPNVSSDARKKNSIQDIPEGLIEKLKDLEPKMFKQDDDEDGLWHFGYIAQDVERVLYNYALEEVGYEDAQEYVKDFAFLHKDESYLSLLYGEIAVLREKEMRDRIAKLELQIEELKGV